MQKSGVIFKPTPSRTTDVFYEALQKAYPKMKKIHEDMMNEEVTEFNKWMK